MLGDHAIFDMHLDVNRRPIPAPSSERNSIPLASSVSCARSMERYEHKLGRPLSNLLRVAVPSPVAFEKSINVQFSIARAARNCAGVTVNISKTSLPERLCSPLQCSSPDRHVVVVHGTQGVDWRRVHPRHAQGAQERCQACQQVRVAARQEPGLGFLARAERHRHRSAPIELYGDAPHVEQTGRHGRGRPGRHQRPLGRHEATSRGAALCRPQREARSAEDGQHGQATEDHEVSHSHRRTGLCRMRQPAGACQNLLSSNASCGKFSHAYQARRFGRRPTAPPARSPRPSDRSPAAVAVARRELWGVTGSTVADETVQARRC